MAAVITTSAVMRRGLASLLGDGGWLMWEENDAAAPGVVIWDFPSGGSAADVEQMRVLGQGAPVVVMASRITPALLADLMAAGATGIVDRDLDESAIMQAVRAVADGRVVINAGHAPTGSSSRAPELTRREAQVLELLCAGRTNHEIAEELVISDNTVKNHVRRLFEKLHVRSRTEAVVRAARWGLVRIDGAESAGPSSLPAGP
ncbi:MAG: hypothetical protein RL347_1830 [Actinomycetota bacterium]|jgi:two-component system NarL family response regulator